MNLVYGQPPSHVNVNVFNIDFTCTSAHVGGEAQKKTLSILLQINYTAKSTTDVLQVATFTGFYTSKLSIASTCNKFV